MKTALLTTFFIAAGTPQAGAATGSLFDRLGIAHPSVPVSVLLAPRISAPQGYTLPGPISAPYPIAASASAGSPASLPKSDDRPGTGAATLFISGKAEAAPVQQAMADTAETNAKKYTPKAGVSDKHMSDDDAQSKIKNDDMSQAPDAPYAKILQTYGTKDGDLNRFDYAGLSKNSGDMKALNGYIKKLAKMTPSAMNRNEALAYWANLYNALTVQVVAQNWPVKSIKEIKSGTFKPGPWGLDLVTVEGKAMTLNNIEHDTMRAKYDEPRIHYMVNCASIGCPNLMLRPWNAETLNADADAAAKAFINSPRGAKVSGGKLTVSSIFKWYKKDFGGNDTGVITHLKQYAQGDLKNALDGVSKISKDQYNWDVNAK